jgi:sec-independent protein translocase protein TatA
MGLLQPMHLLIILIVVLIIFGPGKLPDAGKAFGKMIQEFRSSSREGLDDQDK